VAEGEGAHPDEEPGAVAEQGRVAHAAEQQPADRQAARPRSLSERRPVSVRRPSRSRGGDDEPGQRQHQQRLGEHIAEPHPIGTGGGRPADQVDDGQQPE